METVGTPNAWDLNPEFTTSLVAQLAKNLPAIQETQAQSLGQRDPLAPFTAWPNVWSQPKDMVDLPFLLPHCNFNGEGSVPP